MWDDRIRPFTCRCWVIAPDARGHGASDNATRPFRHTDDVAALLRHLDTGPAVLAGVSMGPGTAVDTALEHPDQVRALMVSGAGTSEPTFTDPWTQTVLGQWTAAMAAGDLDGAIYAFALFAAGPGRSLDDVPQESSPGSGTWPGAPWASTALGTGTGPCRYGKPGSARRRSPSRCSPTWLPTAG